MPNFSHVKLGVSRPSRHDGRTLRVSRFLNPFQMPAGPPQTNWRAKFNASSMFCNDELGCCTVAAAAHTEQVWSANTSGQVAITDEQIKDDYFKVTGGPDVGAELIDVLKYWRTSGIAGNEIAAYAKADHTSKSEVQASIWTFGPLFAGVGLPKPWAEAEVWDVDPVGSLTGDWEPGSWGLHCVDLVDYDADGLWVSTWGELVRLTWPAFFAYFFEAWAAIDNLWTPSGEPAPNGYDPQMIVNYLSAL
jgi:hypothetical protein